MRLFLKCVWVGFALVILTACGGGTTDPKQDQTITKKEISGYVILDTPVAGATIEVYDLNGTLLAKKENATDNDGRFSVNLPDEAKTVLIKNNNNEIYSVDLETIKQNDIVLTPLYFLRNELRESYPPQDNVAMHIEIMEKLFELIQYKDNNASSLIDTINNSNKEFLANELSKYHKKSKYYYKCYKNGAVFPLHITCFSNQDVSWYVDGEIKSQESIYSTDINESKKIILEWKDKHKREYLVSGYTKLKTKQMTIDSGYSSKIKLDGATVLIPAETFDNQERLTVRLLKNDPSDHGIPGYAIEVKPTKKSTMAKKPITIQIPLSSQMLNEAYNNNLKILKIDEYGKTVLIPDINFDKKIASVKINSFSIYKPIVVSDTISYSTFVDALNDTIGWFNSNGYKKTFYDVLKDNADTEMKKYLENIKIGDIDLESIFQTKLNNSSTTLSESLISLYNELVNLQRDYGERVPDYIHILTEMHGDNTYHDAIMKDTLSSLGEFFKLGENTSVDFTGDVTVKLNGVDISLPTSSFFKQELYLKYKGFFTDYYTNAIQLIQNSYKYEDPWTTAVQGVEALVAIESMFMALPTVVSIGFDNHRSTQVSVLSETIKKVKGYNAKICNSDIHNVFNRDGGLGMNSSNWWNRNLLHDVPTHTLSFDEGKNRLVCGNGIVEINKIDFLLMSQVYKKFKQNAADLENRLEFINNTIKEILLIAKARAKKGIDGLVDVSFPFKEITTSQHDVVSYSGDLKTQYYIENSSSLLKIKPKEDYYLKKVNIKFYDAENTLLKELNYDKIDSNGIVVKAEVLSTLESGVGPQAVHIVINSDLYKDGWISDSRLIPFEFDDIIEITRYDSKIKIDKQSVLANMHFGFPELTIDQYGDIHLSISNTGNLAQYGGAYMNARLEFYSGGKLLQKVYVSEKVRNFNTTLKVGTVSGELIDALKKVTTLDLKLQASFSFTSPILKREVAISEDEFGLRSYTINTIVNNYKGTSENPDESTEVTNLFTIEPDFETFLPNSGYDRFIFTRDRDLLTHNFVPDEDLVDGKITIYRDQKEIIKRKNITLNFVNKNRYNVDVSTEYAYVFYKTLSSEMEKELNKPGKYKVVFSSRYGISQSIFEIPSNNSPSITIVGSNPATIIEGSTYVDAGAKAKDTEDGDLTSKITIIKNNVDTSKAGEYEVIYRVIDSDGNSVTKVRVVKVVAPTDNNTKPTITLLGDNPARIVEGSFYTDAGAKANDAEDGDLTSKITIIKNNVDTSKAGEYEIVYEVEDSKGATATAVRKVIVLQEIPNYKLSLVDENYKDNTIVKPSDINGFINKWWKLKNISNHEAEDLVLVKDSSKECNLIVTTNSNKKYTLAINSSDTFTQVFQAPTKDGIYSCYYKVKDKEGHYYSINGSSSIWIKIQYKSDALLVNSDFDSEIKVNSTAKMVVQANSGNKPYSISINWGDGSNDTYSQNKIEAVYSHTYTKVGTYQVSINVKDRANKEYNHKYTLKVSNTVSLTTSWSGFVDAIKQNGTNSGNTEYPIVATKDGSVWVYSIDYTQASDDTLYYTGIKLPVPQGLIALDKKLRVSYITQIDISTGFWNYDREHWIKTDTKKYGAVIEDAKDGMNDSGIWVVKDLNSGTRIDASVNAFIDFVVEHKGYSGYALEIDNGNINTYQYKQNDDGSFVNDLEQIYSYSDSVGSYLSQIHFDCKGKCKLVLAKLEYDLNDDGDFDDANETLILNTSDKTVNWKQFGKGESVINENNNTNTSSGNYRLKKTGQTKSYDENGNEVTYGGIKDDGYYQKGVTPTYSRDDAKKIVTDNMTGLMWQDDENATTITKNWEDAKSYCQSLALGGYSDWRLASIEELQSIVDYGSVYPSPSLKKDSFLNSSGYEHWSSTEQNSDNAYGIYFYDGSTRYWDKSYELGVRCVRGKKIANSNFSRNNTTGIVTDNSTGLQWQDDYGDLGRMKIGSWVEAIDYCENLDLGGYSDWRLPNINELRTTIDYSQSRFTANKVFNLRTFESCWASTSYANNPRVAWSVYYLYGEVIGLNKDLDSNKLHVRCVRGGE